MSVPGGWPAPRHARRQEVPCHYRRRAARAGPSPGQRPLVTCPAAVAGAIGAGPRHGTRTNKRPGPGSLPAEFQVIIIRVMIVAAM